LDGSSVVFAANAAEGKYELPAGFLNPEVSGACQPPTLLSGQGRTISMDDEQFKRMAGIHNRLKKWFCGEGKGCVMTFGSTIRGGVAFTFNKRPLDSLSALELETKTDDELYTLLVHAMDDFVQPEPIILG
jgi:hypothetical protein